MTLTSRRAPTPRTVLAISSLGVLMAFIDATIVNIAFPDIGADFPEKQHLGALVGAERLQHRPRRLPGRGRAGSPTCSAARRVFLLGLFVFTLSSVLCAIAPTLDALVVFRVVQALGAALDRALVARRWCLTPSRRIGARTRSPCSSAVGALAAGLGPSLGGLLVAADGWRLVFLVNLPVGIAALLAPRADIWSRAGLPAGAGFPACPGR